MLCCWKMSNQDGGPQDGGPQDRRPQDCDDDGVGKVGYDSGGG